MWGLNNLCQSLAKLIICLKNIYLHYLLKPSKSVSSKNCLKHVLTTKITSQFRELAHPAVTVCPDGHTPWLAYQHILNQ